MIYLRLFAEFFKIGLFSFGGGYATIPFLYQISIAYGWYTLKELSQIIAIASITPGPVGINAATYSGMKTSGILGAITATTAEVLPAIILVLFVSKVLNKYSDNNYVKSAIECLKPIGCALLSSVLIGLIKPEIHNLCGMILLSFLLLVSFKSKKSPILYIVISAFFGIFCKAVIQ